MSNPNIVVTSFLSGEKSCVLIAIKNSYLAPLDLFEEKLTLFRDELGLAWGFNYNLVGSPNYTDAVAYLKSFPGFDHSELWRIYATDNHPDVTVLAASLCVYVEKVVVPFIEYVAYCKQLRETDTSRYVVVGEFGGSN